MPGSRTALSAPGPSAGPLRSLPAALVGLRAILGPLLLLLAVRGQAGAWIATVLVAAFLSDVCDGIVARRMGVATERLRVADSRADGLYYACAALAVCVTRWDVVKQYRVPLILVLALQLASYVLDWLRYGRIAPLHAYSAKLWGVALFGAAVGLLALQAGGWCLWPAIVLGVLSNLDAAAIKLLLPTWTHDVPSVVHALALRKRDRGADELH